MIPEYTAVTVVVDSENKVTGLQAGSTSVSQPSFTAWVTVSYPATVNTLVTLTLTGPTGVGTVASIPATTSIEIGQTASAAFDITILSNPGFSGTAPAQLTFMITASLSPAAGPPVEQSATFTVTGPQPPVNIQ